MTDDEREAVFAESRRLLEMPDPEFQRRNLHDEDALEKWTRGMPKPEGPRRPPEPSRRDIEHLRAKDWNAWICGHLDIERRPMRKRFAKKLRFERDVLREALGQLFGNERKKIAALEARIAAMETVIQKQDRSVEGEVVDWSLVRKHDAA